MEEQTKEWEQTPAAMCGILVFTSEPCAAIPHIAEAAADIPFSLWDSCMELLLVQITFPPMTMIRCTK